MSALNGDKARYQRFRKAALLRRDRSRAIQAELKRRSAAAKQRTSDGEHVVTPGQPA